VLGYNDHHRFFNDHKIDGAILTDWIVANTKITILQVNSLQQIAEQETNTLLYFGLSMGATYEAFKFVQV